MSHQNCRVLGGCFCPNACVSSRVKLYADGIKRIFETNDFLAAKNTWAGWQDLSAEDQIGISKILGLPVSEVSKRLSDYAKGITSETALKQADEMQTQQAIAPMQEVRNIDQESMPSPPSATSDQFSPRLNKTALLALGGLFLLGGMK